MIIQDLVAIGSKTTMRIGGKARYFAELKTKSDVEEAVKFSQDKKIPLIILGGGSNTIFADGVIEALVVRVTHDTTTIDGNSVTVGTGKILASLINECAEKNLDLSPLTGIPGMLGGALVGNAGQGAGGIWLDTFVTSVTFYHNAQWQTFSRDECDFHYRESIFKKMSPAPILWEARLKIPSRPMVDVKNTIETLIKKRIETQPHLRTAGSCFKSLADRTPAWKLIDAAGLRGTQIGDVQIAEKHANFLLNLGKANFTDAVKMVELVRERVPEDLDVEMRFIDERGSMVF